MNNNSDASISVPSLPPLPLPLPLPPSDSASKDEKGKQQSRAKRNPKTTTRLEVMCKIEGLWERPAKATITPAGNHYSLLELLSSRKVEHFYVRGIMFFPPRDKKCYKKREALQQISYTVKHSEERGAMIRFMLRERLVPCSSKCLYDLIRRTEEDGHPIGDNEWSRPGRPTKEAPRRKGWTGSITAVAGMIR